jgi:hypothetical protein
MTNRVKRVKDGVRIEFAMGTVVTLSVKAAAALAEVLAWEACQAEPKEVAKSAVTA